MIGSEGDAAFEGFDFLDEVADFLKLAVDGGEADVGDLVDLATDLGIIEKSGSWYSFKGERLGQGRENAKATLLENKVICDTVETLVRTHFGLLNEAKPAS